MSIVGSRVDRYELEEHLGEGGMASVFRVKHVELETTHAMKLLKQVSPAISKRMLQEGRIQAQLRHPNIVAVTDVVRQGGQIGLVMDFVDGLSLGLLLYGKDLSPEQIDVLAAGMFDGIERAHQLKLVHRDLKPDNIILELGERELRPRIMDFGLAKALRDELRVGRATRVGAMMGTPRYMAPEQYRDASAVDARADIFSLGAILYEMLAGQPVFPDDDLPIVIARNQLGEWTPLDELCPDAPQHWIDAVHACLALDPDDRPASIAAVRALWRPEQHFDPVWTTEEMELIATFEEELPPPGSELFSEPSVSPEPSVALAPRTSSSPSLEPRVWQLGLGMMLLLGAGVGAVLGGVVLALVVFRGSEPVVDAPDGPGIADVADPPVPAEVEAPSPPSPAEDEQRAGEPTRAPPPAPVAAPEPRPVRSAPRPEAPPPAPSPPAERPAPAVVAPTPTPAPTPAPAVVVERDPTLARVTLPGLDGYLLGADGSRHGLSDVPPGTYDLYVFWDIQKPELATGVTLSAGEVRAFRCDAIARICK